MSKFSTATMLGLQGPKGVTGISGIKGHKGKMPPVPVIKSYSLSYGGIVFTAWIEPDTFAAIEDEANLNGDELAFIKVINQRDWESIREAWAAAWQKQKAYRAFELGDFADE